MMAPSTRNRRLLFRQRQIVAALSLFATSAVVAWTYFSQEQSQLLPRPFQGLGMYSWNWTGKEEDWTGTRQSDNSLNEDVELESSNPWDMTCHEAVERDMRVAVYDFTPFHDEVIGSMISSMNDTGIRTDVYRRFFRYGFSDILDTFLPNDDGEAYHWWDHLYPKLIAGEYDALILTSCDDYWIEQPLLEILETLTRIPIICLHHEIWSFKRHRPQLINSAKAGKLSFFVLGEHVKTLVKEENLEPLTLDGEDGDFDWTSVPAEVFVPIFPLPESIPVPSRAPLAKHVVPNEVAIIGNVNNWGWRNYEKFWDDLKRAINGSPAEWGYSISPDNGHFVPDASLSNVQPFKVHLFGARQEGVEIPPELEEHVLVFHTGLDYVDYYRELSKLDLILPILGSDIWNEYIRNRATAAFPAGVISRVPSLVTPQLLKSYNYLEAPAVILHPDGTDEVEVLAAMRRGEDPWTVGDTDEDETSIPIDRNIASPLLDGYLQNRTKHHQRDWEGYIGDIRAYNAKLLCKSLLR